MTIEQLRATYDATPFRSFVIHLADGRQIPVPSREFIQAARVVEPSSFSMRRRFTLSICSW